MSGATVCPILAVIPARGGSKGLPGKNIRELAGLPLLVHSLRCAAMCKEITRTVVSTDSKEISEVARAHGGEVPFLRPAELATDSASLTPTLAHALREMDRIDGVRYEAVLLLDPTSPARLPADVSEAVRLLEADPALDGVVACSEPTFNPFFVGVVERDEIMAPVFGREHAYQRRQDAPRFLRVNGALYLWRRRWLEREEDRQWLDAPHRALVIPEERALSIDTLYEFEVARVMLESKLLRLPWLEDS